MSADAESSAGPAVPTSVELLAKLSEISLRLETVEGEAEVRRLQARYALLCDSPCPDPSVVTLEDRLDAILALYSENAVWEGVGPQYSDQFGVVRGHEGIASHFRRFWGEEQRTLVVNVHYLTSERIAVTGSTAIGQWVHVQPWIYADGTAVLRSSRLFNAFRREPQGWRITRTRTENVFIANLPNDFAHTFVRASALIN